MVLRCVFHRKVSRRCGGCAGADEACPLVKRTFLMILLVLVGCSSSSTSDNAVQNDVCDAVLDDWVSFEGAIDELEATGCGSGS